ARVLDPVGRRPASAGAAVVVGCDAAERGHAAARADRRPAAVLAADASLRLRRLRPGEAQRRLPAPAVDGHAGPRFAIHRELAGDLVHGQALQPVDGRHDLARDLAQGQPAQTRRTGLPYSALGREARPGPAAAVLTARLP